MKNDKNYTTKVKADLFEVTKPLLESMYMEFKELSKKKPDASISKNKIKIVNRLLNSLCTILADEDSIGFLDILDEDDIPQTSDVTLILSQYVASMSSFENKYHIFNGIKYIWNTK